MDLACIIAAVLPLSTKPPSPSKGPLVLGLWGERVAANYLRRSGCKILYRNYRAVQGGEVDLVCRDQETLIFVEVKTRRSEHYSRPLDAVDKKKRKLIQRGALSWLRLLKNPELTFRFDVIEVIASEPLETRWIKNVFQLPEPLRY
ncbi:MAG: YraN family protein [Chthoniobacterales bacterium]|nr:YraN family protein [Chthoniobacterales bacterium]